MKFLSKASLPPDLRGSGQLWKKEKDFVTAWLDLSKMPPLAIHEGLIDPDLALRLAHEDTTRAALKNHSSPEALDHFVAAFCRQVPRDLSVHSRYYTWRSIAEQLGGPETARIFVAVMTDKASLQKSGRQVPFAGNLYLHGAAGVLAHIGDATCIPAVLLCIFRLYRMKERFLHGWVHNQLTAIIKRLALSPADLEDWCVPDAAEADEVPEFRKEQVLRLQKAMFTDRRWAIEMFDRRIVHQLVMAPLAAGLVWGYYDETGKLIQPFVIGPGSVGSGSEYPAAPAGASAGASVGIVHPVHLPAPEATRWRKRANHLNAPFEQWNVAAQVLSPEELKGDRIPRLPGIKLPAATLLCRLEALGWQRTKDRTMFQFHGRPFPELGVRAVIRYTGIPLTHGEEWPDQSVLECFFTADRQQISLSQVSPIAISVVLADLEALGGK
jgi:hypothetical protein